MMYQHGQQLGLTSRHKFTLFAGVILPAIAVTVEATTHICAQVVFDPMPTSWHMLLVLLVPVAQLQVWFAIGRNDPNSLRLAGFANAAAIVISLFYSFIYLPLLPFAALTLLIALGLLPLAPFFALTTALIMRKQLRGLAAAAPKKHFALTTKGFLISLAVGLAVIGVAELPAILTRHGLQMAASDSPQKRSEGIRFLRQYGNRDYLLQRCYDYRGRSLYLLSDWLSEDDPVKADQVRDIYYRVTGEPFNASPPPRRINARTTRQDDFEFEKNADGTTTGGILKGLSLARSEIAGKVDADGGVGHLEWALTFENSSYSGKEARAEIQLPPGAVVSGLTQWTGSIENETQFTGRSDFTSEREPRDRWQPRVVVTTAGRDRVLVQSYPVPAFGKGIELRLSITVPLVLETKDQARLILPHFNSRNFHIRENFKHGILIDSNHPLTSDYGLAVHSVARSYTNGFQMYGAFSDAEIMRPETALRLARTDSDHGIWSLNPFELDGSIVKQSLEERTPSHLRRIVLVVDTSASMAEWGNQIRSALNVLPSDMDVQLVRADAQGLHESGLDVVVTGGISQIAMFLNETSFAGGADNAPALIKAWDLATETPGNNAIVWIHSPQRVTLTSVESLLSRMESRFYGPSLYSVQTSAGSDEIVKKLDGINEVKSVVRLGSLRTDLERLFQQLSGQVPALEFVRSVKHPQPDPNVDGIETSNHLAQLWANDEVARILGARDQSLKEAATLLALRYKLVTPTSSAVIMKTPKQIDRGDLEPIETFTATEMAAPNYGDLLFLAFIFFVWLIYTKVRRTVPSVYIT
jgi:hypothetical protein